MKANRAIGLDYRERPEEVAYLLGSAQPSLLFGPGKDAAPTSRPAAHNEGPSKLKIGPMPRGGSRYLPPRHRSRHHSKDHRNWAAAVTRTGLPIDQNVWRIECQTTRSFGNFLRFWRARYNRLSANGLWLGCGAGLGMRQRRYGRRKPAGALWRGARRVRPLTSCAPHQDPGSCPFAVPICLFAAGSLL